MRVLIDADGCPVVRETVRQCAAFHVPCLLFCDTAHVFSIPGVEVFVADCGHDSTDYLLLSHLRPGDVVITQDYGLAALCLARSAQALHPAGHAYTKDNIDALLTVRAESARLRRGDTLADAAEYFCVTEDFLRKAYALYRDMGYSFGAEEKA